MQIRKAFKFRIFPNKAQQEKLSVQFGCARFVYNHYRRVREEYYQETGSGLNYYDCAQDLADRLKPEYTFLREANAQVLQQVLKDLDTAYQRFFKGLADYPRFKRKHGKQSIRYPQDFKFSSNQIYLPKFGWVDCVYHRSMTGTAKNVTVSRTKTGKYFVSVQCEYETVEPTRKDGAVGVDLGLKHFAVLSDGTKIDNPKHLKKSERRLKIRQRRLSRAKKVATDETNSVML